MFVKMFNTTHLHTIAYSVSLFVIYTLSLSGKKLFHFQFFIAVV